MKLTEEEKAVRKEQRKNRDHAWRERVKMRDAREALLLSGEPATLVRIHQEACVALNAAIEAKRARVAYWNEEIAKLRATADADIALLDPGIIAARNSRDEAAAARLHAVDAVAKQVDAEFPDLVGDARWSATCGRRPDNLGHLG